MFNKTVRVEDWVATPLKERPCVSFLNEPVIDVVRGNSLTYKIVTPTMEYDRDFFTRLEIDPLELSTLPEINNEDLALELSRITRVEREECNYRGEWAPSAVMYTETSIVYAAQTNDGPKTFVRKV